MASPGNSALARLVRRKPLRRPSRTIIKAVPEAVVLGCVSACPGIGTARAGGLPADPDPGDCSTVERPDVRRTAGRDAQRPQIGQQRKYLDIEARDGASVFGSGTI